MMKYVSSIVLRLSGYHLHFRNKTLSSKILGPVPLRFFIPGKKFSIISAYVHFLVAVYMVLTWDDFLPVLSTGMKRDERFHN